MKCSMSKKEDKSMLLGLSVPGKDNHKRITKGDNFCLYGGDARRHDLMVEEVLIFNELMKKSGKTLNQLSRQEYYAIVQEIRAKKKFNSAWLFGKDFYN